MSPTTSRGDSGSAASSTLKELTKTVGVDELTHVEAQHVSKNKHRWYFRIYATLSKSFLLIIESTFKFYVFFEGSLLLYKGEPCIH